MFNLDEVSTTDPLFLALYNLAGSITKPTPYPGPYNIAGTGVGLWIRELLLQEGIISSSDKGTQFHLLGHRPFTQLRSSSDTVLRLGVAEDLEAEFPQNALLAYNYLSFILQSSNQTALAEEIERLILQERTTLLPELPLETNPAKQLAYDLLERVPIWICAEHLFGLAEGIQESMALVAKSFSVVPPRSGLEFLMTGLEARHEQGDPLIAVIIGQDATTLLAEEILSTRVDRVINLEPLAGHSVTAEAMGYWYRLNWTFYYLAHLYGIEPGNLASLDKLNPPL